ncbi:MAG: ArsR family transcriptional regulator [Chlamydiales bacterium]|nr:ArsR family transcriptional regulator [Chlamydiales bacterium]
MLERLFGNTTIEKVLFDILVNESTYASKLAKIFNSQVYSIQKALKRLEQGGIIVSQAAGKTVLYCFNPRYPFLKELKEFLRKAYQSLPEKMRLDYYERVARKRPRRKGKPLGPV